MFVGMEQELLTWKEKLDLLEKGKSLPVENSNTVYSAINELKKISTKKFGIRTHPSTLEKRVIRIK